MPRLSESVRAAMGDWWTLVLSAVSGGFTTTDTVAAAADVARQYGQSIGFDTNAAIATLYGYARRMENAAAALGGLAPGDVLGPDQIAVPPWARDEQVMDTAPIWHVTFTYNALDSAGNPVTEFRTSIFEMTLPDTAGDLFSALQSDAEAMAAKYGHTLVSISPHSILAV
jgi:hypothetical protein